MSDAEESIHFHNEWKAMWWQRINSTEKEIGESQSVW
jgi:hypothetical protein